MARAFITGSSDGLGLMAARLLIEEGHSVIAHARGEQRAEETLAALPGAERVVTGDLSSMAHTRDVAAQVNALGGVDAVIYNSSVGPCERRRIETADGLSHVFEVNVLAPYILTSLIARPRRLVYLTSGMHRGGDPALDDPQWQHRGWRCPQAYSDSKLKLYDLTLALAVARRWPHVRSNASTPAGCRPRWAARARRTTSRRGPRRRPGWPSATSRRRWSAGSTSFTGSRSGSTRRPATPSSRTR